MWFRKNRRLDGLPVRGVESAPRRFPKFGSRLVEVLEGRALMSMGGLGNAKMHDQAVHHPHSAIAQTNLCPRLGRGGPRRDSSLDLVNPLGPRPEPDRRLVGQRQRHGPVCTLRRLGVKQGLRVTIPAPAGSPAGTTSAPTGIVFNATSDFFAVTKGGKSGKSVFLFDTEDGTISGWNPGVDVTNAVLAVDKSASGAVYKGLSSGRESRRGRRLSLRHELPAPGTVTTSLTRPSPTSPTPNSPAGSRTRTSRRGSHLSGSRTSTGSCLLTYAKQDAARKRRRRGPWARLRRRVQYRRPSDRASRLTWHAQLALGPRGGPERLRAVQRRPLGRRLRRRPDQRLQAGPPRQMTTSTASLKTPRIIRSRLTASGGWHSATAARRGRPAPCSSPPASAARPTACSGP